MTELRTDNYLTEETYAEYEFNGTNYGVTSTTNGTTETFYFAKYDGKTWNNYGDSIFTIENTEQNALVRLDLTIKNNTTYVFYSTYNTQNDTTKFYTQTSSIDTISWNNISDKQLNTELVPDLEFGYDPYVADNGYIYISYASSEEPKSYKVRFYNGTNWDYVVNKTVNEDTEDVTYLAGSIYNNNVYVAYSYIDNNENSGLYVKVANNGTWQTVFTPENLNDNTVVDFNFDYTDTGLSLEYSIATVENHTTEINTKNFN